MPLIEAICAQHDELTAWRRDFHKHPELGYQEERTAGLVAERLRQFGCDDVITGMAGTGVVGVIHGKEAGKGDGVGLRADMDALPIVEETGLPYASIHQGKMHACGHDGHTTMLLGAARYLAATRDFAGTVYAIFQPAEEGGAGGERMVQEGLFARFPMREIYGMHNWPGHPVGTFAAIAGPMMAAVDTFDITLAGRGGHAAMPQDTIDPIIAATHLVQALNTIIARNVRASDQAVVSVTQIHAGDAFNVIPASAIVRGTVRTYDPTTREAIEERIRHMITGVDATFGVSGTLRYWRGYPPTVNSEAETAFALRVASEIVGDTHIDTNISPSMGGEDFAYMLSERPGCYIRVGNGPASGGRQLHSPQFDFNDEILPYGASYWARLAERALPLSA
ncbi:MAG: M20 aminoacylase family protein [Geminicoccaceae bacterium]